MKLSPFDVIVVPFPYSDRLAEKRRPALVISSAPLAQELGRVWVAMITSAAAEHLGDAALEDLEPAGLPAPSIVRASKIATMEVSRIIRPAGSLSPSDRKRASRALLACAGY